MPSRSLAASPAASRWIFATPPSANPPTSADRPPLRHEGSGIDPEGMPRRSAFRGSRKSSHGAAGAALRRAGASRAGAGPKADRRLSADPAGLSQQRPSGRSAGVGIGCGRAGLPATERHARLRRDRICVTLTELPVIREIEQVEGPHSARPHHAEIPLSARKPSNRAKHRSGSSSCRRWVVSGTKA